MVCSVPGDQQLLAMDHCWSDNWVLRGGQMWVRRCEGGDTVSVRHCDERYCVGAASCGLGSVRAPVVLAL